MSLSRRLQVASAGYLLTGLSACFTAFPAGDDDGGAGLVGDAAPREPDGRVPTLLLDLGLRDASHSAAFIEGPDAAERPDAAPRPDASMPDPDAFLVTPDAFQPAPDGFVPGPDAFVPHPDAFVPHPDAFMPPPDAFFPQPDAFVPVDAGCEPIGNEVCDGVDEDCDGEIDEDADCGRWAEDQCTVWLGQADVNAPPEGSPVWSNCPGVLADDDGDTVCVGTRGDGKFRALFMIGDVNFDDWFGIAFKCADPYEPALAAYVQSHCRLWLGHQDSYPDDAPLHRASWGGCPADAQNLDGDARCTSTFGDGAFHRISMVGDVDTNDVFGVAFTCEDPQQPARAARLQTQIQVFLGLRRSGNGNDGSGSYGDCPGSDHDDEGNDRCAGTAGDGAFHLIHPPSDLGSDNNDWMSVALKRRR